MESSINRVSSLLDFERVSFSPPITTSSGAIMVPFMYNDIPIYLQTPIVLCPVGFRLFDTTGTTKLMINPTPEMCTFIRSIDDFVIDSILAHGGDWFSKPQTNRDITKALFYESLKTTKNYPTSMSVRMRFNKDTGLPAFTLFDTDRQEIVFFDTDGLNKLIDVIKPKCSVRLIMSNASIWYVGGRFGYGWDCVQIQLCNSGAITNTKTCLFTEDTDY